MRDRAEVTDGPVPTRRHDRPCRRIICEDLRAGCPALTDRDGYRGSYDYLTVDTSPDRRAVTVIPASRGLRD